MEKLSSLVNHFNSLWPESEIADWDRSGLMIGDLSTEVHTVVLSVDVTIDVLSHAKDLGANLILSHHPMFLRGTHTLREDTAKGSEQHLLSRMTWQFFRLTLTPILSPTGSRRP